MAKAITTIRQTLNYKPAAGAWFAANQALFNQVASFYFSVIQAHALVLALGKQEALTALEQLTHTTKKNPHPVMPLSQVAADVPAMFRRAAIHAALGSARSFSSHLNKWRAEKEKTLAKGKPFTKRPPVPPRSWKKSAVIYAGQWKERTDNSIMLKLWTGSCWSWVRCRITGRALPADVELGSPQLVRHGKAWWLHTPMERKVSRPAKVEEQLTTNAQTKLCAVDLNLDGAIAVCTVQTAEGSTIATRFIGGGRAVSGFRKKQLGRIACNRSKTGLLARGEQDNADLWRKITQRDNDLIPDTQKNDQEEKPQAPLPRGARSPKGEGVSVSQAAYGQEQPSIAPPGHGSPNGHGTAQKGKRRRMGTASLSIPTILRP